MNNRIMVHASGVNLAAHVCRRGSGAAAETLWGHVCAYAGPAGQDGMSKLQPLLRQSLANEVSPECMTRVPE